MASPHHASTWRDRLAACAVWLGAGLVAGVLLWLMADVVVHGITAINWKFLTAAPLDAGRSGGIGPILVSTALVAGVCMAVTLPLALGAALFLAEFCREPRGIGGWVRRSLDVLAGVPSIVFGLFGAALFVRLFGFSLLSGGLTLSCMVLPFVIRTTETALLQVPPAQRLGAAALGLGPKAMLLRVVLPVAVPGVVAGLVLGIGRALAETAALIFTSGYVDRMPGSLLDSGRVLSIHIFDLTMNVPGGDRNAYAAATVLLLALMAINAAAGGLARMLLGERGAAS